jgi:hypothetical protein
MTISNLIFLGIGCTAHSREDETQNARRNPRLTKFIFSNEPFEKRSGMTIEDFGLHSDDHFESHLLGNGLYLS